MLWLITYHPDRQDICAIRDRVQSLKFKAAVTNSNYIISANPMREIRIPRVRRRRASFVRLCALPAISFPLYQIKNLFILYSLTRARAQLSPFTPPQRRRAAAGHNFSDRRRDVVPSVM